MKRAFPLVVLLLGFTVGCRHHADLGQPATQENFGVDMARMNLWREAMFRFQRAVQLNPADAMAHNNLAVAYEANGDFDAAAKEYREALRLDRSNQYIQKNYSRYTEFMSRNRKRQQKRATPTAPAAAAASDAPISGTTPAPGMVTAASPGPPATPAGPTSVAVPPDLTPPIPASPPPLKPPGGSQ